MSKRACDSCNVRKIFCDGKQPCESCTRAKVDCTFLKTHLRPGPRKPRVKTFQLINSSQIDWKLGQGRRKRRRSASTDDESTPEVKKIFHCRIPHNVLLHYIEIYVQKLYPVWPVLFCDDLKVRLDDESDLEAYALACAVSAAVIGQLRMECIFELEDASPLTGVVMATEAVRLRSLYNYREKFTKEAIMTSFFLHVHYVNRHGKSKSGLVFLRESIAFAQAMRLDRESTYAGHKDDEAKRKLYWLLFITDVSYAIQHSFPTSLEMSINFPTMTDEEEPVLCGFMNLILLFTRLNKYKMVIDSWVYQEKMSCSEEVLKLLQRELSEAFPYQIPSNEIQKADLLATRSWMRLVAWNVAMNHGFLSSDSNNAEMALNYPALIAEDLLEDFSTLPRSAIDAHGNVMELKLFEITNSLGDLLIHAPLLFETNTWKSGPRDYFLQLMDHMAQFKNINQSILSIILEKGEKIGLPIPPRRPSLDDSDDNKSEIRFVHELTEEATKGFRRGRGSRSSASGVRRTIAARADSVDSDWTTDSHSEKPRRKSSLFDEEFAFIPTTSSVSSPLRTAITNEYFDPFLTPTTNGDQ